MLSAKYWWLLLLVAQNTSKTLILRLAVGGKGKFLYSAAVLATEYEILTFVGMTPADKPALCLAAPLNLTWHGQGQRGA